MISIAVCDDNPAHLKDIERCLDILMFDRCEYSISCYSNSSAIAGSIENNTFSYDLVFLDIHMKPYTGIQIASGIRRMKINTEIVFLTADDTYIRDGYKFRALDYLLKPVSVKCLGEVIDRFFEQKRTTNSLFSVKIGRTIHQMTSGNILYFSSMGRKITLTGIHQTMEFYAQMEDVEKQLKGIEFVRVHQSYIVNLRYVTQINRTELIMLDGKLIPISRSKQKDMKNRYLAYCDLFSNVSKR